MNIKELFQNANKDDTIKIISQKYKIKSFLKLLSLEKIFSQIENFETENDVSDYYYMYIPYYSAYSKEAETDSFFTLKKQLLSVYKDFDSYERILLLSRVIPEELTITEILNSEICPLSLVNFTKEELCADILWELLFYNQTLIGREKAITNFIHNTKQISLQNNVSKSHITLFEEDVENNIIKNLLASYPYYQSALATIEK